MKRTLLDIFSEMFTAMQVKSAKFDHWSLDTGTGNVLAGGKKANKGPAKEFSIADNVKKVNKTKREKV